METDFGIAVFAIILTVGVADAIPRRLDTGSGWTSFDDDDDGRSGSLGRAGGGETETGSFSLVRNLRWTGLSRAVPGRVAKSRFE